MLHTAVPTEPAMSLFSSGMGSASASCGMQDRLIIHPPVNEAVSFAWSDFPVVAQHADLHFPSFQQYQPAEDDFSSWSESSSSSSSSDSEADPETLMSETSSETSSLSSSSTTTTRRKKVSFATSLEIRTHSLVLGDHPCCPSLPLQLGWEYDDTELINLDIYEQHKSYRTGKVNRLSYLERKNLLKRVSGMCERDLQEATEEARQMSTLRHSNSFRNDSELSGLALANIV